MNGRTHSVSPTVSGILTGETAVRPSWALLAGTSEERFLLVSLHLWEMFQYLFLLILPVWLEEGKRDFQLVNVGYRHSRRFPWQCKGMGPGFYRLLSRPLPITHFCCCSLLGQVGVTTRGHWLPVMGGCRDSAGQRALWDGRWIVIKGGKTH